MSNIYEDKNKSINEIKVSNKQMDATMYKELDMNVPIVHDEISKRPDMASKPSQKDSNDLFAKTSFKSGMFDSFAKKQKKSSANNSDEIKAHANQVSELNRERNQSEDYSLSEHENKHLKKQAEYERLTAHNKMNAKFVEKKAGKIHKNELKHGDYGYYHELDKKYIDNDSPDAWIVEEVNEEEYNENGPLISDWKSKIQHEFNERSKKWEEDEAQKEKEFKEAHPDELYTRNISDVVDWLEDQKKDHGASKAFDNIIDAMYSLNSSLELHKKIIEQKKEGKVEDTYLENIEYAWSQISDYLAIRKGAKSENGKLRLKVLGEVKNYCEELRNNVKVTLPNDDTALVNRESNPSGDMLSHMMLLESRAYSLRHEDEKKHGWNDVYKELSSFVNEDLTQYHRDNYKKGTVDVSQIHGYEFIINYMKDYIKKHKSPKSDNGKARLDTAKEILDFMNGLK